MTSVLKEETRDLLPNEAVMVAVGLAGRKDYTTAENILRQVLVIDPEHYHAQNSLGAMLVETDRPYEALYRFSRAAKIDKTAAMARSNHAMVMGALGHLGEAEIEYRVALKMDPKNPIIWSNLGNTLERMRRYDSALTALKESNRLDPNHALTYMNIGVVLSRLGRHNEAIASFNRCLAQDPDNEEAHYNRGIEHLILGDYAKGWADYEYRTGVKELRAGLPGAKPTAYYLGPFVEPLWTGEQSLSGKTILVHAEQGLGDSIHFMRYIDLLLARNPLQINLVVHKPLAALTAEVYSGQAVTVLRTGEMIPEFNYWSPLMSLPGAFKTTLDTIPPPWAIGNIVPPPADWEKSDRLRVGVCWAGNWRHKNDINRSIDLEMFAKFLKGRPERFYNLMPEVRPIDRAAFDTLDMVNVASEFKDFRDTAATMQCLDLVISVDTATAHFAASMGKPTWLLLPKQGVDWRWMEGREDSPWYPSARLFRNVDGWDDVFTRVHEALDALRQSRT